MQKEKPVSFALLGLTASAIVLSGCASSGAQSLDATSPISVAGAFSAGRTIVVAHRGCWRAAPENSIAAIEVCAALGVDMVEIDIRETADGELVLMHDNTLDRTTSFEGALSDYTLAELRGARLREGAGGEEASVTPMPIATLAEALRAAGGRMLINLDIKETLYDRAFDIIDAAEAEDRVLFKMRAAPSDPALKGARFLRRTAFMPILVQCTDQARDRYCVDDLGDGARLYDAYDPVAIEIVFSSNAFLYENAKPLADAGYLLWVNTLYPSISGGRHDDDALSDPDQVWGTLIDQGVTIFQTDRPELLLLYLKERGLR